VHAGSAARLEQSYRDMANQVGLPDRSESQANMFELMRSWLLDENNGAWLLVLDNADDFAVFRSLPGCDQHHLSRYLPLNKHGCVVVTSRLVSVVSQLVEEQDIFNIIPMHKADAQNLLKKKLGDAATDGVNELAVELEYMPLALVQAATYISKRRPHYSVQQYLEEFRRNDKRKARLLKEEAGHIRRDEEAKNSIIITWQISFEHIWCTRRSAADLLSLMSFFDRQGIPKALLLDWGISHSVREYAQANNGEHSSNDEDDSASDSSTDGDFLDDILTLRDYSIVSQTTNPETLEMHSLVQLATQRWLEDKGELESWRQQFVSTLSPAFPLGQYENWDTCRPLFPHAMRALDQRPQNEESGKEWATLMYNAAWYAWERGDIEKTERLAKASMKTRSKFLGAESDLTLNSMAMLGLAYRAAGCWKAAEELQVQEMETCKEKVGADHLSTLISMSNLALTYWKQGRLEAAEELQVQVLETCKATHGADHLSTLISMSNLALTYWKQGRWEAAEELEVQVLDTRKATLGVDHPDTLISMGNLASTYRNQGRWEAAEELQVQVMETRKEKLGADHPDTLLSMGNLALIYRNQQRWEAAEELEVQVLDTRKATLGVDHPDTLISMQNLAVTWKYRGRDEEAIALMQQCVQLSLQRLGATHPDTMGSMEWLSEWESPEAS
jgi:tetratricopeptide (TPR) repeat protein